MYRSLCTMALGTLLWHAPLLLAQTAAQPKDDAQAARAIVERAVNVLGGLPKLDAIKAGHRKIKGKFYSEDASFTGETFSEGQDKIKLTQSYLDRENQINSSYTMTMVGERGWITFDGITVEMNEKRLARMARARHADKVGGLLTLLRDKGYTLATLGDTIIKDKPAVGIKVVSANQPEIHLFFSKETGYLCKSWQKFKEMSEDDEDGKEIVHELYFDGYQLFDQAAPDEKLLREAKLAVEPPALLEYLRKRTPSPETKSLVKQLLSQLRDPVFRVRAKASVELRKLGPEISYAIREAAKDDDEEVARRTQQLLEQFAAAPESKLVPAALRLLEIRKPAGAASILLDYLPWAPDEKVADDVRAALVAVSKPNGEPDPVLTAALTGADPIRKLAAQLALGKDDGAWAKRPWRRYVVEGVSLSLRCEMYRNGKRHMDLETLELQLYHRLDDSVFARP